MFQKESLRSLDLVTHAYNPSPQKAEAGQEWIQGQSGLQKYKQTNLKEIDK